MRKNVLYITYQSTYRDIRQLLRTFKQYSFPLVDSEGTQTLIHGHDMYMYMYFYHRVSYIDRIRLS